MIERPDAGRSKAQQKPIKCEVVIDSPTIGVAIVLLIEATVTTSVQITQFSGVANSLPYGAGVPRAVRTTGC